MPLVVMPRPSQASEVRYSRSFRSRVSLRFGAWPRTAGSSATTSNTFPATNPHRLMRATPLEMNETRVPSCVRSGGGARKIRSSGAISQLAEQLAEVAEHPAIGDTASDDPED